MTHIESTKKKSTANDNKKSKKDSAVSKDPTMKTAFIRVTKVNKIGEDKNLVETFTEERIKDILNEWAFTAEIEYWFIDHIPDDEDPNDHFHIVIKFKNTTKFSVIKNKFPYGRIETAKNIKRAVQYLVHLNNPEKKQYSWDSVISNCGDLSPYKVLSRSQAEIHLQGIIEKIANGEITPNNYQEKIPVDIYAKYSQAIKNAFQHTADKIISDINREIKVIYIYGRSGIGKTTYAKAYCKAVHPDEEPCISSSGNDSLQDYKWQKALILDDFRDSHFKYSDLIKFLDPHTRSSGKSRYVNKHFLGDLIILTSTQALDMIYKGCENTTENMKELRRRITEYHEFKDSKIVIYLYAGNNKYIMFKQFNNPYYGWDEQQAAKAKFDYKVYDQLGVQLEDPTPATSNPGSLDPVTNPSWGSARVPSKDPAPGCEVIHYSGTRVHPVKSITQIKIEEPQSMA